jgi:hypothetical protein
MDDLYTGKMGTIKRTITTLCTIAGLRRICLVETPLKRRRSDKARFDAKGGCVLMECLTSAILQYFIL